MQRWIEPDVERPLEGLFRFSSRLSTHFEIIINSFFKGTLERINVRSFITDQSTDKFNLSEENAIIVAVMDRTEITLK